ATLEWAIPSPPPEFNFAEVPTVHSAVPQWDARRAAGGHLPEPAPHSGEGIHMPNPSWRPLVAAIGVTIVWVSVLFTAAAWPWWMLTLGGVAIMLYGIFSWAFEPAG